MLIAKIIVGAVILIFGRQIFWLFVAVVGFAVGMSITAVLFAGLPVWATLAIALFCGMLGAFTALFLKRGAIALAGFLAGGYIAMGVSIFLGVEIVPLFWIIFAAGGIAGCLLAVTLFDWALILLSSLAGAVLILEGIPLNPLGKALLFGALLIAGVLIQRGMMLFRRV
ncbi:MAG: hypothetical protein ACMUIS_10815 [bacterium]